MKAGADCRYYPLQWEEPYKSRRLACGLQMYSTLKIERGGKQRQMDRWAANFRAFDAPVMLAALEEGLGVVKGERVSLNADDSTSADSDARLPESRSGKLLRRTMRQIFNGEEYTVPSTMDDPRSLNEITA